MIARNLARWIDPREPVLERVPIALMPSQRSLSGLRIAHLSDIHVGPSLRRKHLERIAAEVAEVAPDLIAITGDIMNWQRQYLEDAVTGLKQLRAGLGVYAVLGNHDFYFGAGRLVRALHEATPIRFIGKKRLSLPDAPGLSITGVNDPMVGMRERWHYPELVSLSKENDPADFNLLLAHRPDVFDAAHRHGYDLALAGHTHGGQIEFGTPESPRNIARLATEHDRGLFERDRTKLYVSRGIGYSGIAFRIGCPPELALIELHAG